MKKDCRNVKDMIQESLDQGAALPVLVEEHLKNCPACCSFKESLEQFSMKLKASLDKEIETLGPPKFSCLPERLSERRGHMQFLLWIAALICFAVISLFGYRGYISYRTKSFLREENRLFVESLFTQSILEQEDSLENMALSTTWFQGSDTVSELTEDFSLEHEIDQ